MNITLLFSVERYEEVARAYMSALERRKLAGQPVTGVASVASFFLSRIDTRIDEQLRRKLAGGMSEAERLLGKSAVAGIDVPQVTRELLDEGIEKFIDSFDDILQTIGAKASIASQAGEPGNATRSSQSADGRPAT